MYFIIGRVRIVGLAYVLYIAEYAEHWWELQC